jgi:CDP-glucose 4,6-dehydratase
VNFSFWERKRVLITGHTGFKGSWLSLWLQFLGADVLGYALEPATKPSLFKLAAVADGMTSLTGDIRDEDRLQQIIAEYQPEIVFHMAAQALVLESYKNPVTTYATNVMGTAHLLESVRRVGGVRAVVIVTSDKCYENHEWVWPYRECDPLGGYDPYSSSKGCAEIVIAAYRRSFFNSDGYPDRMKGVASARAGNVIGGGDWSKDRLVPDVLRSLMNGEPLTIRKNSAIRPWQHVLEPLNGYLTLAEHLYKDARSFSEAWNFGPLESGAQPVSAVVDQLTSLWGGYDSSTPHLTRGAHEDNYLMLDCSKAHARLGWKPVIDLRTALRWTVDWAKSFQAKADMRNVTERQIVRFMAIADNSIVDGITVDHKETRDVPEQKVTPLQEDLFDLVSDGVMTRSIDGTIGFWNRRAEELYGWRKEEAMGKVSHDLLQTQFPKPLEEIDSELVQKGRWEGKLVHTTRDGRRVVIKSRWILDLKGQRGAVVEINTRPILSFSRAAVGISSAILTNAPYCLV